MIDEKVKGYASLVKRNKSSVIDKDQAAYEAALARRKKAIEMKQRELKIDELIQKNEMLENKVDDIQNKLDLVLDYLRSIKK